MNSTKEEYEVLIKIRKDLISKIKKRNIPEASQLESILELIDEYSPYKSNGDTQIILKDENPVEKSNLNRSDIPLKPSFALKNLFKSNPDKSFSPPELRNFLKELKDKGKLNHRGKDLLGTTHTTIKVLIEHNIIEKIKPTPESDPVYKLKKKNNEVEFLK